MASYEDEMTAAKRRAATRARILYCCMATAHRTHRALVDIARERGWIAHTAPYEYLEGFTADDLPYDGVISHFGAEDTLRLCEVIGGRPHLTLHADSARHLDMPSVVMDHSAAGRRVAQHFISLHFKQFAAIGIEDVVFSQRFAGFSDGIREAGLPVPQKVMVGRTAMLDYRKGVSLIADALKSMPMPLAVMAHNDRFAIRIMHACWHYGFSIPAQVAICGFDNDPIASDLALVPLSSIDTNPEAQMREATAILAGLLDGSCVERKQVLIEPTRLVVRHSSGVVASENLNVAKALAYIHQHVWSADLSIPEIAKELGIAETTLYAAFRTELSVTPLNYITNLRIEKAKRLLGKSERKMSEIRADCGFSSDYQMYMAFKRTTGKSPGSFK